MKYAQDLIAFDKTYAALFSSKAKSADSDHGIAHAEFLKFVPFPIAPLHLLTCQPRRATQTFVSFSSGTGIHYAPSAIVDPTHQACATHLIVGQRVPPQALVRAADGRPFELQDLLPSDGRYKLLVFAGDTHDTSQLARVRSFSDAIGEEGAFGKEVVGGEREKWLDVLTVCSTPLQDVNYTEVPPALRLHWSKYVSAFFLYPPRQEADSDCACPGCSWTAST